MTLPNLSWTPGSLVLSIQAKAAVSPMLPLLARRSPEALQDRLLNPFSSRSLRKWWIPPGHHPTRRTGHRMWPMDLIPVPQGCHPMGHMQIGKSTSGCQNMANMHKASLAFPKQTLGIS